MKGSWDLWLNGFSKWKRESCTQKCDFKKIRSDTGHFVFKHFSVVQKAVHGHMQVNTLTLNLNTL